MRKNLGAHRVVQTIVVGNHGSLGIGTQVTTLSAFSDLWNVFSPPVAVEIAGPHESTRNGFVRVGFSLRGAMGTVRGRIARHA